MNKRARLTAIIAGVAAVSMLGLAYAAEPLYSTFCRLTGFGGTTGVAAEAPDRVLDRQVRVRFDANVDPAAPLKFVAVQPFMDLKLGEKAMAFYEVTNISDKPVTALASYNVAPDAAGQYFKKIECFCFKEKSYAPGETVRLPVVFFVDPDMDKDRHARAVRTITLSYTYFRAETSKSARLEDASALQ